MASNFQYIMHVLEFFRIGNFLQEANCQFAPDITIVTMRLIAKPFVGDAITNH